jgi:hypothetical protein
VVDDGDTFTLDNGDGSPPVTFELTLDVVLSDPAHVPITLSAGDDAAAVAHAMIDVINIQPTLKITASHLGGALVRLTHDRLTSTGNVPIDEDVGDPSFHAIGMSGGAGGDCNSGESCQSDQDCESGDCDSNVCQ